MTLEAPNPTPKAPATTSATIEFILNGKPVSVRADTDRSLLAVLREDFGCTSLKNGCEPQASCGCCTLLVDGAARVSCTTKPKQIAGKHIITLEGLPEKTRRELADSFVSCGGVQCGFCIPGMAMRGYSVAKDNPEPSRPEVAHELRGHICRCTGYTKIIDAIQTFARTHHGGGPVPMHEQSGGVGTSLHRYHGHELVLGDFKYVDDITIPGSLYASMRFSDHPRAKVLAIDATAAMKVPGVRRVITAADVPGDRIVGLITKDWPVLVAIGEITRCVGDVLAVVVADDKLAARAGAAALDVKYEVLEPVTSPEKALEPGSPLVHASGNLLSKSYIHRGDAEAALAASVHVVEETFQTQRIEHMFLEPEACIAIPEGQGSGMKLRVLSQGQGVFDDQRQIASLLGWDKSRVLVELVQNGGAFGGKEDMSVQGQTALAAALCGRPVKCTLTREESFRLHPKRHPIKMHMKVGCDAEGRFTAVWARMIGDKGAYASVGAKVLERAAGHACGPYKVPVVDVEALAVYTNNPPCGAMRGFGANQAAFALESLVNRLAKKVGIDEWEIRARNILEQGDRFATGQILDKPFGLKQTLMAVRDEYRSAKFAGIACGIKNVGIGNGMPDAGKAVMRVEADGTVSIRTGFTEMGQGYFTLLIQTAVDQTGLPPSIFRPRTDTSADLNCGQTTASRATVLGCKAVLEASQKLKADLSKGGTLASLAGREYRGEWACEYTTKLGADVPNPKTHLTYGFATQVVILNDDGSIKKVIAAHDVGKVMNPTLLSGQIEGSVHMGLGYALTEDFVCEGGHIVSDTIKSVGVLRAYQMPPVECKFIEVPDPETAYGSRGVGEIGLVPTAAAVAGALTRFDGIERTSLPMRDSPAAKAMSLPSKKPMKNP